MSVSRMHAVGDLRRLCVIVIVVLAFPLFGGGKKEFQLGCYVSVTSGGFVKAFAEKDVISLFR